MPGYFTPKINFSLLMAPVGCTKNQTGEMKFVSNFIDEMTTTMIDDMHIYNWLPPDRNLARAEEAFCNIPGIKEFCEWMGNELINEDVMNMDRIDVGMANMPSGQTWRALIYYLQ